MTLVKTYQAVAPSVVAFISKFGKSQPGLTPLAPAIFGTGFLVHEDGIVATNRHVAEVFETIPKNPLTGANAYAALLGDYEGTAEQERDADLSFRMMVVDVFGYSTIGGNSQQAGWYGEPNPDIAFVQLEMKQTPFLKLANSDFYIQPGTAIRNRGFPDGKPSLNPNG
jgi:Trypsin-like peptidase domain